MEVRIESMICVWDDAIPTMFIEFVNLLTLTTSEEGLRRSVKEFAEKHELDKSKNNDYEYTDDHQRSKHLYGSRYGEI